MKSLRRAPKRAATAVIAVMDAKTQVWVEFGEAIENYFCLVSRKFLKTIQCLRKGRQGLAQAVFSKGGELLPTGDIVWQWKEHL